MSVEMWAQGRYGVRFEWGPVGASYVSGREGALVIVDVLSFTTAVSVGVERGIAVHPAASEYGDAEELAREVGAQLAVGRREASAERPWSLSPATLRSASVPARLVLPSPNGSAIAAAARGVVVAACLRNARAVGAWLSERHGGLEEAITVIAAGERWPDGSLRPGLEDLLGAGAVIAALAPGDISTASPEALAAKSAYESVRSVPDAVRSCMSGVELAAGGFPEDVEIAVEVDVSDVVPLMVDGAFQRA